MLKKLYYLLFPTYVVLETKFVTYQEGDQMIKESADKPESERWVLAKEEDTNHVFGMVYLCRKIRITGFTKFFSSKCPKCPTGRVSHSHSEPMGSTTVEVYECVACKEKFV